MRLRHRVGLFGLLSLSATVLVSGRAGGAPAPASGNPPRSALADRIAHTDPSGFRSSPAVHGGAGTLDFGRALTADGQDALFYFLHRGVIQPKAGIGAHFHNHCEEMFVILDGEAQFTDRWPHLVAQRPGRGADADGARRTASTTRPTCRCSGSTST